jgi:hypothetical protein
MSGIEQYFICDGRLYIKQSMVNEDSSLSLWGWHYFYDGKFRMCAKEPQRVCDMVELSGEEFRAELFTAKL